MNTRTSVSTLCVLGVLAAIACSSKNGDQEEDRDGMGSLGSVDFTSASGADIPQGWEDPVNTEYGLQAIPPDKVGEITNIENKCDGTEREPEAAPSVIAFVVDISSTMNDPAPEGTDTRWHVARPALREAIGDLPDNIGVGITFYPNMKGTAGQAPQPVSACIDTKDNVAPALLNSDQRALIDDVLTTVDAPSGGAGTPTHDAFNIAVQDLLDSDMGGQKYVAILTDGQPTVSLSCTGTRNPCTPEPTAPIIQAIADAYDQHGIKTFLIGAPGSDMNTCTNEDIRGWLSDAAVAGSTSTAGCSSAGNPFCHFDISRSTNFRNSLRDALGSIVGSVVRCSYEVPKPRNNTVVQLDQVSLLFGSGSGEYSVVLPTADPKCKKGWHYSDDNQKIELCPETCNYVLSNNLATMRVVFGCAELGLPTIIE